MLTIRRYVLATMALLTLAGAGALAANFTIVVNGRVVDTTGNEPAIVRGSLLVPLAAIGTAMGAYLEWRPATRTVYGRQDMNEFLLPVNSSTATVNGKPQTLEAPAAIIGGHTMVPLRFVATALGANVRFDGATKTVYITTEGTGTNGNTGTNVNTGGNNPPTAAVNISRFFVAPDRPLRGGDTFTVTMEGTPGERATFSYGSHTNVPMREDSPGHYTATVTIPAKAASERTIVTGRLASGNTVQQVQAGDPVVVDTQPPLIKEMSPKAGTNVPTNQPYITAEFDDQGQTGVDPATVRLLVNDEDVTPQASVTANGVVYRGTLNPGTTTVKLTVADHAANVANAQWSFTVGGTSTDTPPPAPVIESPKPGDQLASPVTVSGRAEPGTTVRVRTTFSGTVLVVFSQEGEVNAQEVKTGADGRWTTQSFDLPDPGGLRNVKYTITATAINSKGLTSEPTQLTLPRR